MTAQNNTLATAPATITQKELWNLFVNMPIKHGFNIAGVEYRPHWYIDEYKPTDWLIMHGDYAATYEMSEALSGALSNSDAPLDELQLAIDELRGYAEQLETVRRDFETFALTLEGDDDEGEEHRYRRPAIAGSETQPSDDPDFIESGDTPAPNHPDGFIGDDEDTGVGAPPDAPLTEEAVFARIGAMIEKANARLPKTPAGAA